MGLRHRRNANNGSNGRDIGHPRGCVYLLHIGAGLVRPPPGAPELGRVMVKPMRPAAMPPIGIPMGAVIILVRPRRWIWVRLGAQGAQDEDETQHQDNTQPSVQVHSPTLQKEFLQTRVVKLEESRREKVKQFFADYGI